MASLRELLEAPTLRRLLHPLVEGAVHKTVRTIGLVEYLQRLGQTDAEAVVVLAEAASRSASTYRLDMALRVAASRRAVTLVLNCAPTLDTGNG